jgi:hypothetical protein
MASGILGKALTRTYDILYADGPLAQFELGGYSACTGSGNTLNKRVSELERWGVVRWVGEKINPRTGRVCMLWDVTSKIPQQTDEPPKKPTRKEIEKENRELTAEVEVLKRKVRQLEEQTGAQQSFF